MPSLPVDPIPPERAKPSAHERRAVAVAACCGVRAVDRVYAGQPVRQTTALRVLEAIRKLGAPTPPEPTTR